MKTNVLCKSFDNDEKVETVLNIDSIKNIHVEYDGGRLYLYINNNLIENNCMGNSFFIDIKKEEN